MKPFENDVKTYGTETFATKYCGNPLFENDVKTYGTETASRIAGENTCLRMM